MYYRKASLFIYVANIVFWIGISVYYSFSDMEQYAVLKLLLFTEPLVFIASLIGYLRKNRLIFVMTLLFLVVNSILSITDEVGLFDVISLFLNIILFLILALQWKIYLYKS